MAAPTRKCLDCERWLAAYAGRGTAPVRCRQCWRVRKRMMERGAYRQRQAGRPTVGVCECGRQFEQPRQSGTKRRFCLECAQRRAYLRAAAWKLNNPEQVRSRQREWRKKYRRKSRSKLDNSDPAKCECCGVLFKRRSATQRNCSRRCGDVSRRQKQLVYKRHYNAITSAQRVADNRRRRLNWTEGQRARNRDSVWLSQIKARWFRGNAIPADLIGLILMIRRWRQADSARRST